LQIGDQQPAAMVQQVPGSTAATPEPSKTHDQGMLYTVEFRHVPSLSPTVSPDSRGTLGDHQIHAA
jgi:hypothetical protein